MNVEQLHVKVRSLVSNAAPGPWTPLTEIFARDAFMAALDDSELPAAYYANLSAAGGIVGRLRSGTENTSR
jgi:hypothetical protein